MTLTPKVVCFLLIVLGCSGGEAELTRISAAEEIIESGDEHEGSINGIINNLDVILSNGYNQQKGQLQKQLRYEHDNAQQDQEEEGIFADDASSSFFSKYVQSFYQKYNNNNHHNIDDRNFVSTNDNVTKDNVIDMDDNDTDENEAFCDPGMMSMTMFMDGFTLSLFSSSSKNTATMTNSASSTTMAKIKKLPPCLSYYFGSWTLINRGKFIGAMTYSFLLGFMSEGLSSLRTRIIPLLPKQQTNSGFCILLFRRIILTSSYMLQEGLGFFVMLIAMTYSVELLMSALLGLGFGYFIFH